MTQEPSPDEPAHLRKLLDRPLDDWIHDDFGNRALLHAMRGEELPRGSLPPQARGKERGVPDFPLGLVALLLLSAAMTMLALIGLATVFGWVARIISTWG